MLRRIYFDFEIVEFSGSHSDPIIQISCYLTIYLGRVFFH